MANSPLTLRRINKLIGQALTLCQKPMSTAAKDAVRRALRFLNSARRMFKARKMHFCKADLHLAMANLVWVAVLKDVA